MIMLNCYRRSFFRKFLTHSSGVSASRMSQKMAAFVFERVEAEMAVRAGRIRRLERQMVPEKNSWTKNGRKKIYAGRTWSWLVAAVAGRAGGLKNTRFMEKLEYSVSVQSVGFFGERKNGFKHERSEPKEIFFNQNRGRNFVETLSSYFCHCHSKFIETQPSNVDIRKKKKLSHYLPKYPSPRKVTPEPLFYACQPFFLSALHPLKLFEITFYCAFLCHFYQTLSL